MILLGADDYYISAYRAETHSCSQGLSLSVRDCYVDQDCDGMFVTEVTEDTVTAVCDYCS